MEAALLVISILLIIIVLLQSAKSGFVFFAICLVAMFI